MNRASGIYRGTVTHTRQTPTPHSFRYRLYMLYLDLDELPDVFRGRWFWSLEKLNLYSFRRADYLGDSKQPLKDAVLDAVADRLGTRPDGAVRMLTQVRSFGFIFNPVTFYYCFDKHDTVATIVAEITNTPWGERHRYVLPAAPAASEALNFSFRKEFHISPFTDMHVDYDWQFTPPGDGIGVGMSSARDGEQFFHVHMQLAREEATGRAFRGAAWRHPSMTIKVIAGIYWQALRLWMKRTPFFTHPRLASGDTT